MIPYLDMQEGYGFDWVGFSLEGIAGIKISDYVSGDG